MRWTIGLSALDALVGAVFCAVPWVQSTPSGAEYARAMSRECTDRCISPPSACLSRRVAGAIDFIVAADCPTRARTMVWRGEIRGDAVQGSVTLAGARWYRAIRKVPVFRGTRPDVPVDVLARQ